MMALWLLLLLFIACGIVVFAYQRLQGVSDRLKELHEELERNDDQLRRHLTRLEAEHMANNGSQDGPEENESCSPQEPTKE